MNTAQEPKYIINGPVVNRQSGHAIPDDEPVFLLRARDILALSVLEHYLEVAEHCDQEHLDAIQKRIDQFEAFANKHPDRMKEPDTQLTSDWEKDL